LVEAQHWFGEAVERAEVRLADSEAADRRDLGQFFTHPSVAAFMAEVLARGAGTVLEALSLFGELVQPTVEGEAFPPGHPGRVLGDRDQLMRSTHQRGGQVGVEQVTTAGHRLALSVGAGINRSR